jgi:hypothetical protein
MFGLHKPFCSSCPGKKEEEEEEEEEEVISHAHS